MDLIILFICIAVGAVLGFNLAMQELSNLTAEKVSYILDTKNLVLRREKNVNNK
jgi:hypothetical protein